MIRVRHDRVIIFYPMGVKGKEIVEKLRKYGITGEVKEVWCG